MRRFIYILLIGLISGLSVIAQETKPANDNQNHLFKLFFNEALKNRMHGDYKKAVELYLNCLKLDEKSSSVAFELAKIFKFYNDAENANKFVDMALQNDDTNNKFYIEEAVNIKLALQKYDEVLPLLDKLIATDKKSIETYLLASDICVQKQDYDKALQYVESIPSDIQAEEYVLPTKYDILMKKGEKKKAYKLINAKYKKAPENAKYNFFMADYSFRVGKNTDGLGYLAIAAKCEGGDAYNFDLASMMLQMGNIKAFRVHSMTGFASENVQPNVKYQKLLSSLQNKEMISQEESKTFYVSVFDTLIAQYPDNEQFYALYIDYMSAQNQNEKCVELYKKLYDANGRMSSELWRDMLLKLSSLNKPEEVLTYSKVAIEQYPDEALLLLLNGESHVILNQHTEAIAPLRKSYKILLELNDPRFKSIQQAVISDLATSYYYTDSVKLSFFYYEELLKMDPYNATALNNYSYYLSLEKQDLDKAETMARKANEIQPANATFLDTYAWVLYVKGNYSEALFIIERAMDNIDLNHDNTEIHDHYGDILYKNGNKDKAIEYWEKAYSTGKSETIKKKIDDAKK